MGAIGGGSGAVFCIGVAPGVALAGPVAGRVAADVLHGGRPTTGRLERGSTPLGPRLGEESRIQDGRADWTDCFSDSVSQLVMTRAYGSEPRGRSIEPTNPRTGGRASDATANPGRSLGNDVVTRWSFTMRAMTAMGAIGIQEAGRKWGWEPRLRRSRAVRERLCVCPGTPALHHSHGRSGRRDDTSVQRFCVRQWTCELGVLKRQGCQLRSHHQTTF